MNILKTSTPLLLLAAYVYAASTTANETLSNESRGPRVTGRIVKLYSGSRPEPIICHGEGFQSDPNNCAVFYRCVSSGHGKFTVFRYQCGPGTIYDPDTEICNHPKSTKRTDCINFETRQNALNTEIANENDIDFAGTVEVPSPIRTVKPVYTEQTPVKKRDGIVTTKTPWIESTQAQSTSPKWQRPSNSYLPAVNHKSSTQNGDNCNSDGFMGDSDNCRKFYRCVGNGRGGFIRYEFSCSESTIWDDEVQSCNHPFSVRRRRCGKVSDDKKDGTNENKELTTTTKSSESNAPTIQQQTQSNYGSKVSQLQIQINNGSNTIQNQTQFNYGDRVNQSQNQGNYGSDSKQKQNQTSHSSAISQTQSQFNHGDRVVQNQVQIDHTKQSSQMQTQTSESDSGDSTTTPGNQDQTTQKQGNQSNKCTSSGFMGDANNCKKFYRCVDNGNGGYTQYEFSCGEGTVWDQNIEACNHPWAVNKCGNSAAQSSPDSTTIESSSGTTTTTQKTTQTTQQSTTADEEDVGYGNQDQNQESLSSSETTSTTSTQSSTAAQTTITEGHSSQTVCDHNGFIGDDNDCKKFYRCVDNGNGGFTKYEYSCGDGTVWDPQITACNHAWAVERCGGSAIDYNKETTTTKDSQETSTTSSTTMRPTTESEDEDTGYGQTESSSTSTSTTTNAPQSTQEITNDNVCQSSGFMGNSNDCNKFYRCVDNGNGGYTKYEFACGEGTVWDKSIEACNHAWAVKDCKSQLPQTQTEAVTQQTSTTQTVSSESGGNDQNPTSSSSTQPDTTTITTTSESNEEPSEYCQINGFIGDEKDCKKFYRCVDNGQGGFTKYEFTCGDGTVWDSEIQTCNHPSRDNQCGSSQSSSSSTTKEPDRENDEIYTETTSKTTTTDSSSQTTTGEISSTSSNKPQSSSGACESDGFYANPDDCKKFYRCVDDGKGGYTKYDFVCGDGTVWDQEIQGCNHDNGNTNCKQSSSSSATQSSQESTTEDNGTVTESGTTQKTSTTESSANDGQCTSEGFYANPNDCKKFYRCVDNGKGGLTKYDFSCGDGTVWVQEIQACDHDNDVNSCSTQSSATNSPEQQQTTVATNQQTTSSSTTLSTQQQPQADEYPEESSSSSNGQCTSEGFYPDEKDCRNFFRCVDNGNGGYTKYDFACGEGTAWDSEIQACNHISEVNSCEGSGSSQEKPQSQETSTQSTMQDEQPGTTESSTTSTTTTTTLSTSGPCNDNSSESSNSSNPDQCTQEGYYGNSQDCKKFYRCVDNGNGGYTKYDFDCGEGTIWDQDITACNHPRDVNNPSCKNSQESPSSSESSSSESTTESASSQSTSSQSTSSSTTEKNNNQNSSDCSNDNSSQKPERSEVNCTKAGFYANPDDCKKFYRCVDWDGSGEKFSVFHFECGEGTIWDPAVDTCNHEDSVYPPRDCSGSQGQSGDSSSNETTTTSTTTTMESSTTTTESSTTTTEKSTTQSNSETTTQEPTKPEQTTTTEDSSKETTTQQSTTQDATTTEQTTTQQSTTSEQTNTPQTTEQTTTEKTTTQESTTSEQTTTEQSTTTQNTTQESTTSEQTTQKSTTSEQITTQESNTNTQTTQESTTSQQTTEESTTPKQTTTESSTTEGTIQQSSDQTTTQQSTTQESATEEQGSTESTEAAPEKECPETDEDQYLYVCPTGFKRHPKYCDMFYQCTEDDDTHEVKVANFNCPNNTIYDESKTQCVEEDKADKKCDGQKAQKRRFKRLGAHTGDNQPMIVSTQKHSCPAPGHYPFEKQDECSSAFLKCEKTKTGKIRGFVYQCPHMFVYWSVSRRCEPRGKLRNCKDSVNNWSGRWEIPVEFSNVAPPLIDERLKER